MYKTEKRIIKAIRQATGHAVLVSSLLVLSPMSYAQDDARMIDIPSQELNQAIRKFSSETDRQILFSSDLVEGKTSGSVVGRFNGEDGLRELLRGTGLGFEVTPDNVILIRKLPESSSSGTDQGAQQRNIRVEEVYVTARKRQETVQDVPLSITAFSAENLKAMGMRNLADFEGVVPGLNLGGGGNGLKPDSNPYIRGVGQRETKVTLDPAVGTYIDGIYIGRTSGALLDSVGIERVEVLRGPQGTLFGKNTTGGAISVTTKKPSHEFGGDVSVNVGNYGRRDGALTLNVPLIDDTLLSRVTLSSVKSDGYFENVVDGSRWSDDDRLTGIFQLRWLPLEDLTLDLLAERTKIRQSPRAQRCAFIREPGFETFQTSNYNVQAEAAGKPTFEEACRQSQSLPPDKFYSDYTADSILRKGVYEVDTSTVGLTAEWDIGDVGPVSDFQMKSISAWRRTQLMADEDLDGTAAVSLMRISPSPSKTDQYSQEFQFTGTALNERMFFSTGLYWFTEKTPYDELYLSASMTSLLPGTVDDPTFGDYYFSVLLEPARELKQTDNEAYAWYGQMDFDITSQLQFTLGLRYTKEKRWSRYSKSFAAPESVVDDYVMHASLGGGVLFIFSDGPFRSFDQWEYAPYQSKEGEITNHAWTPLASLKYHFHDELLKDLGLNEAMTYFTYSEGFSSGGVDQGVMSADCECAPTTGVPDTVSFDPAKVKSYEVGLKLFGWDRRLQANMSAYYMDYTDMQLTAVASRLGIPIPFIENVGKSSISGFEGEFMILPTSNWQIMLNASYTNASIDEWDARTIDLSSTGVPQGEIITDRSDEPMPRVPRWQAFAMTSYNIPLPDGSLLTPSVAARYMSEIYHGFDRGSFLYGRDAVTSDPTTFVDARLSWLSADERMEVTLWGKNLTNKNRYLVGGIPLTDVNGAVGQVYGNPRTYGLEVTYNFGGG